LRSARCRLTWISGLIRAAAGGCRAYRADGAAGNLTSKIEVNTTDETGQLLAALEMNDNLHSIVGQVRAGTDVISTAASEIATGNLDLSARTEQQASSLEETASSMEELTSTVKQNSDNARRPTSWRIGVRHRAAGRRRGVAGGGDHGLDQRLVRKIVDIIGVIDGIAFQTNILA
jgi:methyl-accepting chemotaxis protein